MKLAQAKARVSPADHADRRLIGGLVVSLLLHALVLLLQFGVPGLGLPGAPPPLTVRIAAVAPTPAPVPQPEPDSPVPQPPQPVAPRPASGMQMLDPVAAPAAPPPKATPLVKKGTPRRARRISTPLPAHETEVETTRVIAQDSKLNDFSVPIARPEEAEKKTVDLTEAQHGEDDGDASDSAALEAAAAKAGKLKAEEEAQARKLAEEKRAAEQAALLAEQKKAEEALRIAEQAAQQQKAEQDAARDREQQLAQQKAEQEQAKLAQQKVEQQRVEQAKAEQLKAEQLKAEQVKSEQLKLEQKKLEQQTAERQRADQLKAEQAQLEKQRVEKQRVEQQRVEQQKLAQQAEQQRLAEQKAAQQRAEQQRAEQQRAEQQRAEQQKADQQRAEREAAQRGRELAASQPGSTGQGGPASGTGAGGGTNKIPKDMLGSDLGNRARDLVKGLDVLRGAPPGVRRAGERRAVVSFNERDLPLKMYVESWRQKIERNGALNYPRSWADAVRVDPLVSVAVRSDGSVEDVIIVSSSGRADMDEAVRRIVRVNARYSPFPPQIAERYDVIEIRRVWRFDDALKLMEELH
jgi:TonB family protein